MAKQTFTSGQVLTAAQVNALQANDYNQTVSNKTASYTLVAADKGTRIVMSNASATAITVNTSLFDAGDTLFIQNIGAGVCTITAGTATVTTASSLALKQWQGGTLYFTSASASIFIASDVAQTPSGLTFITGASFTGVTSVQVNSCFTSTYRNYRIYIDAVGVSISNMLSIRLSVSGTPSTTNYQSGMNSYDYNSGGTFVFTTTSDRTQVVFIDSSGAAAAACGAFVDVMRPQLATSTDFLSLSNGVNSGVRIAGGLCVGKHNVSTAYDGFTIINSAGTNIEGSYRVYGLADS